MKNAKLILIILGILVAAFIVMTVIGFIILAVKVLFVLAVVLFIASMVKKLTAKSRPREISENDSDRELKEAMRQLEEIKRRQLIK
jgi:membrane protein implicated in regulation of membrane protease activity